MDEALKRINEKLKVDESTRREYIEAFEKVSHLFRTFLDETDPLFKTYHRKIYTGSHAIKTRVGIPNEFDVNLCVKLPLILMRNITFTNSTRPGYIQIKTSLDDWAVLKKDPVWEKCKSIEKWVDAEGYLLESKIRTWMESKVQNVLIKHQTSFKEKTNYSINVSKSGPAFTLKVNNDKINFTVDLVPGIVFEYPKWPCNIKHKYAKQYESKEWFAIAKPLGDKKEERFFRASFPLQEIEIFHSQDNLKSVLRLIKSMRDSCELTYIPTYYINTLFMWKIEEESEQYWRQPLSKIFSDMLLKLDEAFNSGEIRCFWIKNQNLLDNLTQSQIQNARNKLKFINRKITADPANIKDIILP